METIPFLGICHPRIASRICLRNQPPSRLIIGRQSSSFSLSRRSIFRSIHFCSDQNSSCLCRILPRMSYYPKRFCIDNNFSNRIRNIIVEFDHCFRVWSIRCDSRALKMDNALYVFFSGYLDWSQCKIMGVSGFQYMRVRFSFGGG